MSTLSLSLATGEEFRDRIPLRLCFSVVGVAGGGLGPFVAQIFTTSSAKEGAAAAGRSESPAEEGSRDWPCLGWGLWTGSCSARGAEVVSHPDNRPWTYTA